MPSILIIVNPVSGKGRGEQALPRMEKYFRESRVDFSIVKTERPWHAKEIAKGTSREKIQCVVSAGGDGTTNEILNGLLEIPEKARPPLGVLCVGNGNDFAYGMGIPKDLREGVKVVVEGYRKKIDVGRVKGGLYPQGRFFGNGVGIGFDAVVGFEAAKMKHISGFLSYAVAALKTVFLYYKPPLVQITTDSRTWTQRSLLISLMNGRRMGGGFLMAPDGNPSDGNLNYCIAGTMPKLKIFPMIVKFMKGTQIGHPVIQAGIFKRMRVKALEGTLPAHADGETLCTQGQNLEIEIFPNAIEVITKAP